MTRLIGILMLTLLIVGPQGEANARRAPKAKGVLLDQSGLLTPQDLRVLRAGLEDLEKSYNVKLGVLIVPSLHDDVIEKFAKKVARRWQFDESLDGALLIVSMREREFYIDSYGKLRKAINTRTLTATNELLFETGQNSVFGVSTRSWLKVFDGLCAEAFIPEIRLGREASQITAERPWLRWLDLPLLILALLWIFVRLKRVRMGEFRHQNVDQGWTSIDRESTFGGGTSRHGSFGGGGGSASWGRSRS